MRSVGGFGQHVWSSVLLGWKLKCHEVGRYAAWMWWIQRLEVRLEVLVSEVRCGLREHERSQIDHLLLSFQRVESEVV